MSASKIRWITLTIAFAGVLVACDRPKSAEQVGKEIDKAAEKAGDKFDAASQKLGEQTAITGAAIEDVAITTQIKSAILSEPGLKVLQITVDTVGGVVTLAGLVDTQVNSDKVKQIASAVSGVKRVENRLIVKTPV